MAEQTEKLKELVVDTDFVPLIIEEESVVFEAELKETDILEMVASTLEDLPATAAGAGAQQGAEDGGHSIVEVAYLAPEIIPDSGFDTTGITLEFDERLEDEDAYTRETVSPLLEEGSDSPTSVETEEDLPPTDEITEEENIGDEDDGDPLPEDEVIVDEEDPIIPEDPEDEDPEDEDPEDEDPEDEDPEDEDPEDEDPEDEEKEHQDNGFGNGDDDAPGGSEDHNNAENAGGNHDGTLDAPGNSAHLDNFVPISPPHIDVS